MLKHTTEKSRELPVTDHGLERNMTVNELKQYMSELNDHTILTIDIGGLGEYGKRKSV